MLLISSFSVDTKKENLMASRSRTKRDTESSNRRGTVKVTEMETFEQDDESHR